MKKRKVRLHAVHEIAWLTASIAILSSNLSSVELSVSPQAPHACHRQSHDHLEGVEEEVEVLLPEVVEEVDHALSHACGQLVNLLPARARCKSCS